MDALRPDDPVSVGAYRLVGRIGAGGMGRVYLGVSPGGRKVAVKLIQPDYASTPEFRERFAREVEAARRVGGFHTAQVVDADPFADPPWMVTAYIPGLSLQAAVSDGGPLGPDEIRALGAGLAEGLAAIHACGLVHRDVKPSNVILGDDGPRIIDFGVARVAGASTMTASGAVLGTIAYMSPEQVNGESAGPASDVFSLASTLVFAATGHSPFSGDTIAAVVHRIAYEPPDLTGLPGEAGFRELVAECLAKNPADRPSLAYILAGLSAAGGNGLAARQPTAAGASVDAGHPLTLAPGAAGTATAPTVSDSTVDGPGQRPPSVAPMPGTEVRDGGRPRQSSPLKRLGNVRHPRAVAAVATAVALAAVGVAIGLTSGGAPHPPGTRGHTVSLASIPVTATSAFPPETGYVYVEYQNESDASAQISGKIKDAASGEVARLYAQQFPFTSAPVPAASLALAPAGTTAQYMFQVTPAVATRYHVELFRSSTATTPLASSSTTTIYVVRTKTSQGSGCKRPVCHEVVTMIVFVPPSALSTEMSKHWYTYFAVNLARTGPEPASPKTLQLGAGDPVVTQPQRVSADEFRLTVTYTFQIGGGSYNSAWRECIKDTEAEDGLGLPGSHGCGNSSAPATGGYLG
jgi:hypothetical protein